MIADFIYTYLILSRKKIFSNGAHSCIVKSDRKCSKSV